MCGLTGFIGKPASREKLESQVREMTDQIVHRGPDDEGIFVEPQNGVGFGFRRLAILDLSPAGHQPMTSRSGRYVLMMNGEIYNFAELRDQVAETEYRSHSDTEILLAAIEQFGFEESLKKCVGMFAMVLWDSKEKTVTLARDRFGEKPLYYGWQNSHFFFASELKSLFVHPAWQGKINRDSLASFMRHGYIGDPHSIFEGIHKLPGGSTITVSTENLSRPEGFDAFAQSNPVNPLATPKFYWNAWEVVRTVKEATFAGTDEEAIQELERRLGETIRREMISDAPLGAFLSGGVDSSLVVAMMQKQASNPVKTFTIGFKEDSYNEANYAKAVANHLGTEHTEFYVSMDEAKDVVPLLATMYDEPFADSSQIPTYLVSKITRQKVTVSLSGDGADEMFCGYDRYPIANSFWKRLSKLPEGTRMLAAKTVSRMSPGTVNALMAGPKLLFPNKLRKYDSQRVGLVARMGSSTCPEMLYEALISAWKEPTTLVLNSHEPRTFVNDVSTYPELDGFYSRMTFLDAVSYLPGDILAKVDRASMAVSLESRAPYLDHRLAEFAWSLPTNMKIRGTTGKWIMKQLLYRHVPRNLIDRPKMGFGVPLAAWLRGGLRDWAESLINKERIESEGYFNANLVAKTWKDHLAGRVNNQHLLWPIITFQAWKDTLQG